MAFLVILESEVEESDREVAERLAETLSDYIFALYGHTTSWHVHEFTEAT